MSLDATVPRPLEFDRERALINAMKLFWEQGYKATSLSALLQAMGIARSSFYASFGDKKSVFIECLRLFGQRTLARTNALADKDAASEPESPITSRIRHFFEATVRDVPSKRLQHGCLLVNTVLELADTDDELAEISSRALAEIEAAFEQILRRAQSQNEWHSALTPHQAARYLMTMNQGLRVQCRKKIAKDELWAGVDLALALIGIPANPKAPYAA